MSSILSADPAASSLVSPAKIQQRDAAALQSRPVTEISRFEQILRKSPRRKPTAGEHQTPPSEQAVYPPALWARPEGPAAGDTRRAAGAGTPEDMRAVMGPKDRVLMGSGPAGSEARVYIGAGPLAGSEIHVHALGGTMDALVLTPTESSRQTLSLAMQEVARRLRHKGHVLRARAPASIAWEPDGLRPAGPDVGEHGNPPRVPISTVGPP